MPTTTRPSLGARMRELAAWNFLGLHVGLELPGHLRLDALHGVDGKAVVSLRQGHGAYGAGVRAAQ